MELLEFNPDTHRYTHTGYPVPGVNEILEKMGVCDFSMVPEELLRYKTEIGKAVHSAIDYELKGILDEESVDPQIRPMLQAFRDFCRDHRFKIEWSERRLFSEAGYAGTGDYGGTMDSLTAYVDVKTGGKYRENRLKTAAYNKILGYDVRGCLYLFEDGTYEWDAHEDPEDYTVWHCLVRAFHWLKPRYSKGRKWTR